MASVAAGLLLEALLLQEQFRLALYWGLLLLFKHFQFHFLEST